MKMATTMIRQIAVDGLYFVMALAVAIGGIWSLNLIDAPVYAMTFYGVFMVPAVLSTATYFGRDINEATHKLIA